MAGVLNTIGRRRRRCRFWVVTSPTGWNPGHAKTSKVPRVYIMLIEKNRSGIGPGSARGWPLRKTLKHVRGHSTPRATERLFPPPRLEVLIRGSNRFFDSRGYQRRWGRYTIDPIKDAPKWSTLRASTLIAPFTRFLLQTQT